MIPFAAPGCCEFTGLMAWLSSVKLADKTITRAEVGGKLTHTLSKENQRPLPDRFDIYTDVPRVDYEKLASDRAGESTEAVRQRVVAARERQLSRIDGSSLTCNADMAWRISVDIANRTTRAKR
jgi:predicted ATPase with chaperone activity